ncbi:hypothetical protein C8Q74DRAFT_1394399 [Fomes fomentarius]|nr:hypothetical protein C8Q74DRAFT_1394399 [Fomes fomentarius]
MDDKTPLPVAGEPRHSKVTGDIGRRRALRDSARKVTMVAFVALLYAATKSLQIWVGLVESPERGSVEFYWDTKCARLLSPLDYDTLDGPTTAIAIQNYRGTTLFDVLGFDLRGMGRTTPSIGCFERPRRGISGSVGTFRARVHVNADRCAEHLGREWGIGQYPSTPNVARDILDISQLLGQDKYFAVMYPDMIKRFTLASMIYDSAPGDIRARYFLPVPLAEPPLVITRNVLVSQLFDSAHVPLTSFLLVARTIYALETRNSTALTAPGRQIVGSARPYGKKSLSIRQVTILIIQYSDIDPYTYDQDAFAWTYRHISHLSLLVPMWAGSWWIFADWKLTPSWRYAENSHWHLSVSSPSLCTVKRIREYFVNGSLIEGTICEVDELPFVGRTDAARALSAEDEDLLEAMRALTKEVPMVGSIHHRPR